MEATGHTASQRRSTAIAVFLSASCLAASISLSDGGVPSQPCNQEDGTRSCCSDYTIPCSKDGNSWTCPQNSNQQGFIVTVTKDGRPGKTQVTQTYAGSCTIERTTCGDQANSCDQVAAPEQRSCYNRTPTGAKC